MEKKKMTEEEKQRRIRIAKNLYQKKWRKKNKDKYLESMEKHWLKKFDEIEGNSENKKKSE